MKDDDQEGQYDGNSLFHCFSKFNEGQSHRVCRLSMSTTSGKELAADSWPSQALKLST